jgi:TetR/AcrR family transcriptional repressor of lmrAB and yxaGH operons
LESGETFANLIREFLPEDVPLPKAVGVFVRGVAQGVENSGYSAGGPLTAIAMETATTSERLNLACREAFDQIQAAFAEKFQNADVEAEEARRLAVMVTSAIEGGIILSRTQHSGEPLHLVATYLTMMIEGILND